MLKRTFLTLADRRIYSEPTEDPSLMAGCYELQPHEKEWIADCRGDHNRLGFAIALAYMKFPGIAMPVDATPPWPMLQFMAEQIGVLATNFADYAERSATRRDHIGQLKQKLGLRSYAADDRHALLASLQEEAFKTDSGSKIAVLIKQHLQAHGILLPAIDTIEDFCREAITAGEKRVNEAIVAPLSGEHLKGLNSLLTAKRESGEYVFTWLKKKFPKPSSKGAEAFIEQHDYIASLKLPPELRSTVPYGRIKSLARFAGNADSDQMRELEPLRRNASLAAFALETGVDSKDCAVNLHERIVLNLHASTRAEANRAFVTDKEALKKDQILGARVVRAFLTACGNKTDPVKAVFAIASPEELDAFATRGENLSTQKKYEPLPLVKKGYNRLHRYAGQMLKAIEWRCTTAGAPLVKAFAAIQQLQGKELPDPALAREIAKGNWRDLVITKDGVDRKYFEICALSRMRDALASGDLSIVGSKVYRDLQSDLPSIEDIDAHIRAGTTGFRENPDWTIFRKDKFPLLLSELTRVNRLIVTNQLPAGTVDPVEGLQLERLQSLVPVEVLKMRRMLYGSMPVGVSITDILIDIDQGERISRRFRHIRKGHPHPNKRLLWTAILALATNQGYSRMANACVDKTTASQLHEVQKEYLTDEAYASAIDELNQIFSENPYAKIWGDGLMGSSDGQWFTSAGLGAAGGGHNPHYGDDPGSKLITHINDQYFIYAKKPAVSPASSESLYLWDAMVSTSTGGTMVEHSTDTGGYSDLNFAAALFFADYLPRIRNIKERKIHLPPGAKSSAFPGLKPLLGKQLRESVMADGWKDFIRIGYVMKHGPPLPSSILRKLRGYRRQNSMAAGMTEIGRLERSLYILRWISDPELRRRVEHILNKGEAVNKLTRALAFHRQGDLHDQTYQGLQNRANALALVSGGVVTWNARGLSTITERFKSLGHELDREILKHVSPATWEHINLAGKYEWNFDAAPALGQFRPLRAL